MLESVRAHEMTPEQRQDFDELLAEVSELQPLPAIAVRLMSMAEDSRFSAQDLAAIIKGDQAITLKILRLANSPAYGMSTRVKSLREAIVLLGFREVRSLALAACVLDSNTRQQIADSTLDYDEFWVNSLAIAHFAQALGSMEGINADEAFTAGIVHNVGRLAMAQHRPDWLRMTAAAARDRGMAVHDVQAAVHGFTDAELGAAVARAWQFPAALAQSVERHAWAPSAITEKKSLDSVVMRARRFARAHGLSDSVDVGRRMTPDYDWQLPKVAKALSEMGAPSGVIARARTFLTEATAS